MFTPLLLLAQVSAAMACAATVPPGAGARGGSGGSTPPASKVVKVTVVSTQKYDPITNHIYLKVFEAKFNAWVKKRGMGNGYGLSDESVVDSNGKFAVVYNFIGVTCGQVRPIMQELKRANSFVDHVNMKCPGRAEFNIY
ncbi:unnamed protein product [Heligmosomoides polygyrus]|uniref:Cystatin domain-containing protein n=1 Tax=Heligmosomoides polygyrus TaxID=6339 RepID=A0A183GTW0_HELPZ|nr:unnamed protein product [Heligmosomoides polygyrus]